MNPASINSNAIASASLPLRQSRPVNPSLIIRGLNSAVTSGPFFWLISAMNHPTAAVSARPYGHSVGFNLAAIALAVAMAGLGLAYGIDAMGSNARPAANTTIARTLGGTTLDIPAAWLREAGQHTDGF